MSLRYCRVLPGASAALLTPASPRRHVGPSRAASARPRASAASEAGQQRVVVVGNGMVGLNFLEKMAKACGGASPSSWPYKLVTFAEEGRPAYHRMNMTQYFGHRDASQLELASGSWYVENGIELHIGDRVTGIDRGRKVVTSSKGEEVPYDKLILATGSSAYFPPVPGKPPPSRHVHTHAPPGSAPFHAMPPRLQPREPLLPTIPSITADCFLVIIHE